VNDLFAREPQLITPKPMYSFDPSAYTFPEALAALSAATGFEPLALQMNASVHAQSLALSAAAQIDTVRCSRHVRLACGVCPAPVVTLPSSSTGITDDTRATSAAMLHPSRRITVLRPRAGAVAPGTHLVRRQTLQKGKAKADTGLPSLVFMQAGTTPLVDLLPRFLRLSALAAVELATEEAESAASVADGPSTAGPGSPEGILGPGGGGGIAPWTPTKNWFMLFAGLTTRAVIEGYIVGGWQGFQAAQAVFNIGAPAVSDPINAEDNTDQPGEFAWFEPDELPSLKEAIRTLFPTQEPNAEGGTAEARRTFQEHMQERLRAVGP
jgi:hypothetical protein